MMQRIPNRPKNANAKTASSSTKTPLSAISFWPALTERLESTPARPTWSLMSAPVSAPGRQMLDAPTAFAKRVRSFNHYIHHFKQMFYSLFLFFSWQLLMMDSSARWRSSWTLTAMRKLIRVTLTRPIAKSSTFAWTASPPGNTVVNSAKSTTLTTNSVICPRTFPNGNNKIYSFFIYLSNKLICVFFYSADWYKDHPLVGGEKEVGDKIVFKNRKT